MSYEFTRYGSISKVGNPRAVIIAVVLPIMAGSWLGYQLHKLTRKALRSHVKATVIIRCEACGQGLRLPQLDEPIEVTCPACKHKVTYISPDAPPARSELDVLEDRIQSLRWQRNGVAITLAVVVALAIGTIRAVYSGMQEGITHSVSDVVDIAGTKGYVLGYRDARESRLMDLPSLPARLRALQSKAPSGTGSDPICMILLDVRKLAGGRRIATRHGS
jgi:DNA-directed RNA polymerase subunit RPC12/RpoP